MPKEPMKNNTLPFFFSALCYSRISFTNLRLPYIYTPDIHHLWSLRTECDWIIMFIHVVMQLCSTETRGQKYTQTFSEEWRSEHDLKDTEMHMKLDICTKEEENEEDMPVCSESTSLSPCMDVYHDQTPAKRVNPMWWTVERIIFTLLTKQLELRMSLRLILKKVPPVKYSRTSQNTAWMIQGPVMSTKSKLATLAPPDMRHKHLM